MLPLERLVTTLDWELCQFIRALELHIAGFVQELPVERNSLDIEQLQPDRVLSFNYSNTYVRVYGADRGLHPWGGWPEQQREDQPTGLRYPGIFER